jgi:hypothetical protein
MVTFVLRAVSQGAKPYGVRGVRQVSGRATVKAVISH